MPILSFFRSLQDGKLRGGKKIQWYVLCTYVSAAHHLNYLSRAALLLEKEPSNLQAQSLAQLIEKAVTRGSSSLLVRYYANTHPCQIHRRIYRDGSGRRSRCARDTNPGGAFTASHTQINLPFKVILMTAPPFSLPCFRFLWPIARQNYGLDHWSTTKYSTQSLP